MKTIAFPSRILKLTPALIAGCVMSAAAAADPNEYTLVYSKSDFTNYQNVAELHKKIVRTARAHCPSYFTTRALADRNACVKDVVADLVRVIDNPKLTAYAEGDTSLRIAGDTSDVDDRS